MILKLLCVRWALAARTPCSGLRWFALAAAVAGPFIFGFMHASQLRAQSGQITDGRLPSFEVTSVRRSHSGENTEFRALPNRLMIRNTPMDRIIQIAYGHDLGEFGFAELGYDRVVGGPKWIHGEN